MPYAFIQDVPANEEMYRQIKAKLGDTPPAGLVCHVALAQEGGLRYVDVWESEAHWERFREETLEPIVGEVLAAYGLPHDHSLVTLEPVEVVDAWRGTGSF
jgi:hypothetical protein